MRSHRTSRQQQIARVSREAAEWLQLMHGDPTADDHRAFMRWMESSPLNVRELMIATALERELSGSNRLDRFDVDAIIERARQNANVVDLPAVLPAQSGSGHHKRRSGSRRMLKWASAAVLAGIVLLAGAGTWSLLPSRSHATQYATSIGEVRALTLADGTVVDMAPKTRLAVDFSPRVRSVTLFAGKAAFKVVHNAARPFQVSAGASLIHDVGTRFSVNRLPSGVVVAVVEGEVKVTQNHRAALHDYVGARLPADVDATKRPGVRVMPLGKSRALVAGEMAHIARDGGEMTLGKIGSDPVMSVAPQRLVFHDSTLADIATEFNRYNAVQIVVKGDAARRERYAGVFNANNVASFLQYLVCCSRLKLSRANNRVVITLPARADRSRH